VEKPPYWNKICKRHQKQKQNMQANKKEIEKTGK
jgi:hypothetical protein